MGKLNNTAIGKPLINLTDVLFCFSLSVSQNCIKSLSFSDNMPQN